MLTKFFAVYLYWSSETRRGGQDTERSRKNERKNKRCKKKMTLRSWF